MSVPLPGARTLLRSARISLGIGGAIALLVGLIILIWPEKSALVMAGIIAAYLVLGGLVYLGLAVFSREKTGWARVGHGVLGALYVIAGVAAFVNLAIAAVTLFIFVAILVGVSWIIDGVVALAYLGDAGSKAWTVVYAVISIVGGIAVLFAPLYGALILWWILGISLIVLGILQIARAITLGNRLEPAAEQPRHAGSDAAG